MRWRTLLMVVATSVAVAACGSSGSGSGGGDGGSKTSSILLYNGQHPELTQAEVAAFQHATGISVNLRTNDGVVLADQLAQEGGDSTGRRLLHRKLAGACRALREGPARSPAAVGSAAGSRSLSLPAGHLGRRGPTRERPRLQPQADLALAAPELHPRSPAPQWKGKVAIAPLDSDFPPVVGAVIATHGAKAAANWVDALKQNAVVYQDDESVVAAVNAGNVPVGVINQYYWYRLRREVGANRIHSNLYYFPGGDPGSVVNISGAAVLASSQHRADAERFINFLVSQKGQKLITSGDDYEYPVRPGVAQNPQEPPLSQIAHTSISARKLGNDVPASKMILNAGFGA